MKLFGISDIEYANRYIRDVYLPVHNQRFAKSPQIAGQSAFVVVRDLTSLADVLCIEQNRVVAGDNTISYEGRSLQLPHSPERTHYVKANVKVQRIPRRHTRGVPTAHDGSHATTPRERRSLKSRPSPASHRARRRQGVAWRGQSLWQGRSNGQP